MKQKLSSKRDQRSVVQIKFGDLILIIKNAILCTLFVSYLEVILTVATRLSGRCRCGESSVVERLE